MKSILVKDSPNHQKVPQEKLKGTKNAEEEPKSYVLTAKRAKAILCSPSVDAREVSSGD